MVGWLCVVIFMILTERERERERDGKAVEQDQMRLVYLGEPS